MKITIDFEARSKASIKDVGSWAYSKHPSTEIICMAYAIDDQPVKAWIPPKVAIKMLFNGGAKNWGDLGNISKRKIRKKILEFKAPDFTKPFVIYAYNSNQETPIWAKYAPLTNVPPVIQVIKDCLTTDTPFFEIEAHNALFEQSVWRHICTPKFGWPEVTLKHWACSAALAAAACLPRSLEDACNAVDSPFKKDVEGGSVMKQVADGNRDLDTWDRVITTVQYCMDDVRAERSLSSMLPPLTPTERQVWELDQEINTRGIKMDLEMIQKGIKIATEYSAYLEEQLSGMTGGLLTNVRQRDKLLLWCEANGYLLQNTQAEYVASLLENPEVPEKVREVLKVRAKLSKTSVAKLNKMLEMLDPVDHHVRDLLMYHGAATGRWSGKGLQIQNFPRGAGDDTDKLFEAIATGDWKVLEKVYEGDPMEALSDCLRGFWTAGEGEELLISDFSNIEGRVTAWLSGEVWKVEAFKNFDKGIGPDIYRLSYEASFGVPVDKQDDDHRQIGKVQELSMGFGGGVGAFQNMAKNYGVIVSDARAKQIKTLWRENHPNVVAKWAECERLFIKALTTGQKQVCELERLTFNYDRKSDCLFLTLPSGRNLRFNAPRLHDAKMPWKNRAGEAVWKKAITYMKVDSVSRKYVRQDTYGGDIFQSCIAEGTEVLTNNGWKPIETVLITDLLWDGEEWVSHDGLIFKGERDTIEVNNINITPEHKVLSNEENWERADSVGFNWKKVRLPNDN